MADRKLIAKLYRDGLTPPQIANAVGINSPSYIRYLLADMGMKEARPRVKLDVGKAKALKRANWPISEIVREFNYNFTAQQIREAVAK